MSDQYTLLESTMPTYQNLAKIPLRRISEDFVIIPKEKILSGYKRESNDMKKILGNKIITRKSVLKLLLNAQRNLERTNSNFKLFVTYGYRDLSTQTKRFNKIRNELIEKSKNKKISDEEVHRFVAVPLVAGHPTGGAVDVTIFDVKTNSFLDFGSKQYDYSSKKCYVFSEEINSKQKENRLLLRKVMTTSGFAPFNGEWWHFSYGDKEWAYYYKKKFAIYDQMRLRNMTLTN